MKMKHLTRYISFLSILAWTLSTSFAAEVTSSTGSGFYISQNLSTVDTAGGDGDDAMESMFMLFSGMPDLTGMTIVSAELQVYAGSVVDLADHDIVDRIYLKVGETWTEATDVATMDSIDMGTHIGESFDPTASSTSTVDITTEIAAIYAADSTPAPLTVKMNSLYWVGALSTDDTVAGLEMGDRGGTGDYLQLADKSDGTNYPRIVIEYKSVTRPNGGSVGIIMSNFKQQLYAPWRYIVSPFWQRDRQIGIISG